MFVNAFSNNQLLTGLINHTGTVSNYVSYLSKSEQLKAEKSKTEEATNSSNSVFNSSLFDSLKSVTSAANSLKSQISSMASVSYGIGTNVSSSVEGVLDASASKSTSIPSFIKTDVTVTQLASAQKNQGAQLVAADNSFGDSFNMSITNNAGTTFDFSVDLAKMGENANNKSALDEMASEINKSGAGVKATVSFDESTGKVSMSIEGATTGSKNGSFIVNDNSAAGLSNVAKEAMSAKYDVNGIQHTSESNDNVNITSGVTANLNRVGFTQLSYSPDADAAVDKVKGFIDAYNQLKESASENYSDLNAKLSQVISSNSRALSFAGIGVDSKGQLTISSMDTLKNSIADGSFARNFQGVTSLGNSLYNVSNNAYKSAYNSAVKENVSQMIKALSSSATSAVSNNNQSNSVYNHLGLLFNGWA